MHNMLKRLLIILMLAFVPMQAQALVNLNNGVTGILPQANGGTGSTSFITGITNAACALNGTTQTACGSFYGYSNPIWFGATGSGSGDDEPAIAAAASAACSGGWLRVKFTQGTYNTQHQFDVPCSGLTLFADPQNATYDGDNEHSAVVYYANTGFFTSVNNCAVNMNGFVDITTDGINYKADGGGQGTVNFCNSHNTTGGDQIPRIYLRNGSSQHYGATVGCSLVKTGITGNPQCFTGSGRTDANLMTVRMINWKGNQNALGIGGGNITDLQADFESEFAGNSCGVIVGALDGTEGIVINAFRSEENGISGISGVCGSGAPAYEVTGPFWQINTQFQGNNGVDVLFDHSCASDSVTGGYSADGQKGVQGAQSTIAFNASCSGTISLNGFVGSVDTTFGQVAPKYFAENISGNNTLSVIGGNTDSGQYTIARDHIVAGTMVYTPIQSLGQDFSTTTTSANAASWIGSNVSGTCMYLNNTSSGGINYQLCSSGSSSSGGAGAINLADVTDAAFVWHTKYNHFEMPSGGLYEWSSTGDPNATVDTSLSRSSAGLIGTNGSIVDVGTKFTTSGGGCTVTGTTGGATAGTFTTSTTGSCITTITFNGATGLTAPNGWACTVEDLTTVPVLFTGLMRQTANSATTATFSGTTAASDVIIFACKPY